MTEKHKALKAVAKGSAKMAGATMISRLLGLVREQVMAGLFGASGLSDAFFVAYRIPNLLRGLFAEGAFSSAFVPTFIGVRQKQGHEGARQLLWKVFFSLAVLTALLSGALAFFSEEIVSIFVDDLFRADNSKFALAVNLTQVMAPYLCLTSLAAVFMGALNSYQSYFTPALAPAVFNLVVIGAAFILPQYIEGENNAYYAISYGIIFGGLAQLLFQLPKLLKLKLAPRKNFEFWVSGYQKNIIAKMGPGVLGTAAQHMSLLVSTILATGSSIGAVSYLTYAFRLFQFPIGVIGVSIGNSFLVEFSKAVKANEKKDALNIFKGSHEFSLILLLPIALIGYIGAESLVKLVFERGLFDSAATAQTALALKYYLISLPFYGYYKSLNASLYALERAKLPVIFSAISLTLSITISWLYIDAMGFQILALSNAIVFISNIILMAIAMRKIEGWGISAYISLRTIKTLLMAMLVAFLAYYFDIEKTSDSLIATVIYLSKLSALIFTSFFLGIFLLGEKKMISSIIKRK